MNLCLEARAVGVIPLAPSQRANSTSHLPLTVCHVAMVANLPSLALSPLPHSTCASRRAHQIPGCNAFTIGASGMSESANLPPSSDTHFKFAAANHGFATVKLQYKKVGGRVACCAINSSHLTMEYCTRYHWSLSDHYHKYSQMFLTNFAVSPLCFPMQATVTFWSVSNINDASTWSSPTSLYSTTVTRP